VLGHLRRIKTQLSAQRRQIERPAHGNCFNLEKVNVAVLFARRLPL
jgi:hypothetical protein